MCDIDLSAFLNPNARRCPACGIPISGSRDHRCDKQFPCYGVCPECGAIYVVEASGERRSVEPTDYPKLRRSGQAALMRQCQERVVKHMIG